jgi:hypothetical protein
LSNPICVPALLNTRMMLSSGSAVSRPLMSTTSVSPLARVNSPISTSALDTLVTAAYSSRKGPLPLDMAAVSSPLPCAAMLLIAPKSGKNWVPLSVTFSVVVTVASGFSGDTRPRVVNGS